MIINLNRSEIAVLLLHMSITRKNIRNGFKRIYKGRHKKVLNSFDEVKNSLEMTIGDIENMDNDKLVEFNFNVNEIKMIDSFLNWYVVRLEKTLKGAGRIIDEDKKQLEVLKNIHKKAGKTLEIQLI